MNDKYIIKKGDTVMFTKTGQSLLNVDNKKHIISSIETHDKITIAFLDDEEMGANIVWLQKVL